MRFGGRRTRVGGVLGCVLGGLGRVLGGLGAVLGGPGAPLGGSVALLDANMAEKSNKRVNKIAFSGSPSHPGRGKMTPKGAQREPKGRLKGSQNG